MIDLEKWTGGEPLVSVGLVERVESVTIILKGSFRDEDGREVPPGVYRVNKKGGRLVLTGPMSLDAERIKLAPVDIDKDWFSLEATIGIEFHWQQREMQTFCGDLRIVPEGDDRVSVINDVPLEKYLTSVVCSEMSATSPSALVKAHSIISRSWLLAQIASRTVSEIGGPVEQTKAGELIRWYDRQAHTHFDVCADDHCQRYQGTGRIVSKSVYESARETRGQVLMYRGATCDTRYSKCCGGVTEDFRTAWADTEIPYLIPVYDGPGDLPLPPLNDETAFRKFLFEKPDVYCNCTDEDVLNQVLVSYDRETRNFFRWQVRLTAVEAGELIKEKLGVDVGRVVSMEPVERGLSGRLVRLRITGDKAQMVIGKELEIRRALSPSHLYSSAFAVDIAGPEKRPEVFVLSGSGWGHGVGLCQIGAAAMAWNGSGYDSILGHYYPGTTIEKIYQ